LLVGERLVAHRLDRQAFGGERGEDRRRGVGRRVVDDGQRVELAQVVPDRRFEDVLLVARDHHAGDPHRRRRAQRPRNSRHAVAARQIASTAPAVRSARPIRR